MNKIDIKYMQDRWYIHEIHHRNKETKGNEKVQSKLDNGNKNIYNWNINKSKGLMKSTADSREEYNDKHNDGLIINE